MSDIERGVFIYGDGSEDSVPIRWKLTEGKALSNNESWLAGVEIDVRGDPNYRGVGTRILGALMQRYVFRLQTVDGSEFPCGIYDLDDFNADAADLHYFVICSRDQPMEYLE